MPNIMFFLALSLYSSEEHLNTYISTVAALKIYIGVPKVSSWRKLDFTSTILDSQYLNEYLQNHLVIYMHHKHTPDW